MKGADSIAQGAVGEACRSGDEAAERGEEGDDARVAPAQGRRRLTVVVGGKDDFLDGAGGDGAVLGHAFERQQAVVDVAADGAKVGEVADVATDADIVGVVEGGLGPQGTLELEVLLDSAVFVVEGGEGNLFAAASERAQRAGLSTGGAAPPRRRPSGRSEGGTWGAVRGPPRAP